MIKFLKLLLLFFLLPVSWIIYGAAQLRKKWIVSRSLQTFPVPILIVGNISMGGTGKTPFVCSLVQALKNKGYQPGVISRGYKAACSSYNPYLVTASSLAELAGDEPVLIAQKTSVPVIICKNRPKAAEYLLEKYPNTNIIISDDGLQHYYLKRDIEVVLLNQSQTENAFLSSLLFPAGPLREPLSRLNSVDFVVNANQIERKLNPVLTLLNKPEVTTELSHFKDQMIYAVAGLAYPDNFFNHLREEDIQVIDCAFPDHYNYKESDFIKLLEYSKYYPVFITEKDAVKLKEYKNYTISNIWVVSLVTIINPDLINHILNKIQKLENN